MSRCASRFGSSNETSPMDPAPLMSSAPRCVLQRAGAGSGGGVGQMEGAHATVTTFAQDRRVCQSRGTEFVGSRR